MEITSRKNLLIAASGSVATIKLSEIIHKFYETDKFNIKVICSEKALLFLNQEQIIKEFADLKIKIYTDKDEWGIWKQKGDPVLHIDLRKWADILIITPLSANTLAKIANGLCDNLIVTKNFNLGLLFTKLDMHCEGMGFFNLS